MRLEAGFRPASLALLALTAGPGMSSGQEPPPWPDPSPLPKYGLEVGVEAPDFELPVLGEAFFEDSAPSIRLSGLRGSHVLLVFWGRLCAPCLLEHPELTKFWRDYRHRDLVVLGVYSRRDSPADTPEAAWAWLQENDPNAFPTVVPPDKTVGKSYVLRGIPRTYLIGPDGIILESWSGWTVEKGREMEEVLQRMLPKG